MIGPYETKHFSADQLFQRLESYIHHVDTKRLIIWNNQSERWFERINRFADDLGIETYLWYPVLADRMDKTIPSEAELVRSARKDLGYGTFGTWNGFVGNDENFLFRCPEHALSLPLVTEEINSSLATYGFSGVFLDRIRYPSPANGLEMLFSCFCNHCLESGHGLQETQAQKAISLMTEFCLSGQYMKWDEFVAVAEIGGLMDRRNSAIEEMVRTIYDSLDHTRFKLGLDLLTPSLAQLVGQDYTRLAPHCDWIKSMTYTKAIGPAGLPLEVNSLIQGLQDADKRIGPQQAAVWIASLLGLQSRQMEELMGTGVFGQDLLQSEIQRSLSLVQDRVPVLAGIELVDHPVFPTKISSSQAEAMIQAVSTMQTGVIACWNLLYIPAENYALLKKAQGVLHG
ncbi:MAG: hypothetical protein RBR15_17395 [Sphaerochaeta sp.]|nr:hypothetical protein [Sphaerochaeta sp.]